VRDAKVEGDEADFSREGRATGMAWTKGKGKKKRVGRPGRERKKKGN